MGRDGQAGLKYRKSGNCRFRVACQLGCRFLLVSSVWTNMFSHICSDRETTISVELPLSIAFCRNAAYHAFNIFAANALYILLCMGIVCWEAPYNSDHCLHIFPYGITCNYMTHVRCNAFHRWFLFVPDTVFEHHFYRIWVVPSMNSVSRCASNDPRCMALYCCTQQKSLGWQLSQIWQKIQGDFLRKKSYYNCLYLFTNYSLWGTTWDKIFKKDRKCVYPLSLYYDVDGIGATPPPFLWKRQWWLVPLWSDH